MNILVVFYSRTGSTRKVGETIARHLKADLEEIFDAKNRQGFLGYFSAGMDAFLKRETELFNYSKDPADYDLVIIGTPIWSIGIAPAIRTYVRQIEPKLKKVAFFCCKSSSPAKQAFDDLAHLCGKQPIAVLEIKEHELKTGKSFQDIAAFAEQIA